MYSHVIWPLLQNVLSRLIGEDTYLQPTTGGAKGLVNRLW